MTFFSEEFINWLDDHADQIDKESCAAGNQLIERIAAKEPFGLAFQKSWEAEVAMIRM